MESCSFVEAVSYTVFWDSGSLQPSCSNVKATDYMLSMESLTDWRHETGDVCCVGRAGGRSKGRITRKLTFGCNHSNTES